jgi:hypothetical protein
LGSPERSQLTDIDMDFGPEDIRKLPPELKADIQEISDLLDHVLVRECGSPVNKVHCHLVELSPRRMQPLFNERDSLRSQTGLID